MYVVVSPFIDTKDNGYEYKLGEVYPREGYKPPKKRIKELSTLSNRRGVYLIAEVVGMPKTSK